MSTTVQFPTQGEIENFGWPEPWLGRGAEPKPAGYRWLADAGFRTVVNLRSCSLTQSVRNAAPELEPIHLPVKNNVAPTEEQVLQWLDICSSPYMCPVFVHCHAGEGRTSTFCALVRIAQGWPLDNAIVEQVAFGFDPDGENKEQMRFLREFAHTRVGGRR
jgi:protein tyrosine/serine phosphatase